MVFRAVDRPAYFFLHDRVSPSAGKEIRTEPPVAWFLPSVYDGIEEQHTFQLSDALENSADFEQALLANKYDRSGFPENDQVKTMVYGI